MRTLVVAALLALGLAVASPAGRAARDLDPVSFSPRGEELVVFEARPCPYCELFRRDVLPGYQMSKSSAEATMRFVDVGQTDIAKLPLAAPLTTVPTVVLMRNGREVGRIAGYTGPETFFKLVAHMLGRGN